METLQAARPWLPAEPVEPWGCDKTVVTREDVAASAVHRDLLCMYLLCAMECYSGFSPQKFTDVAVLSLHVGQE